MRNRRQVEAWTLCALLSIWICVIISNIHPRLTTISASSGEGRPILVLDPGHGGTDGGALSVTGTAESAINWQITVRVYDLARFLGVRTVLTRAAEEIDYPPELNSISARKKWDTRQRVEQVNGMRYAVLVSIHQNCYTTPKPRGVNVLYRDEEISAALAVRLQRALAPVSDTSEQRTAVRAGKDIYLLSHVKAPAVLIECGFISNPTEAVLLEKTEYQKKLSVVIAAVYYDFTGDEQA